MAAQKSLMIVGVGDLAGLILDIVTLSPGIGKIYLAGRNIDSITKRKNLCFLVAAQLGFYPKMESVFLDLCNIEQTAETIRRCKPDIIFNAASFQSWRYITYLPPAVFKVLDQAQLVPWLPMHLTPVYKLMQAVQQSGLKINVVNAAFPDAVCPTLAKVGLAPMVGIGNVANVVPALRGAVALKLNVPVESVDVSLCTQHYFSHRLPATGDSGGAPYHFSVSVNGEDVNKRINIDEIFKSAMSDFPKTGGAFRQMITASSAAAVLLPMLQGERKKTHATGPNGLPGGYPVNISFEEVTLALPSTITQAEAVAINERCQQFDGIEKIDAEGTVYFTEREMLVMKQLLGYECYRMPLADCESRAEELGRKFQELRQRTEKTV